MGAGFGELDAEDATAFSATAGVPLNEAGIPAVSDERCLVRANTLIPDVRGERLRGLWRGHITCLVHQSPVAG